jgi:1,4-dihydroxy-6-naphthoate synthase
MSEKTIRFGHSPDADDAFMFWGFASGKVTIPGYRIEHVLEDIQSLNERAKGAELEVTAVSAHAYAYLSHHYWVMSTGASMGMGYGPVLVSRQYGTLEELKGKTVATPGELTTATLLFRLFTEGIAWENIPFDEIMDRVGTGEFAGGVLIHEGQLTYAREGFRQIVDFGALWAEKSGGLPLPLGLDLVRRDLGWELACELTQALKKSITLGYANQAEAIPYALRWGRGISAEEGTRFVKLYVNDLTLDMGEKGRLALEKLYQEAAARGLIPRCPELRII